MVRNKVFWFGSRDGRKDTSEFDNRGLHLELVNGEERPSNADLRAARGIVYCFGENGVRQASRFAECSISRAFDHGLAVVSIAQTNPILLHVQTEMREMGVPDVVTHRIDLPEPVPDHEIAQRILMIDPKMGWSGDLDIVKAPDLKIDPADELLLRRAFSDCRTIRLTPLSGGRTAETFMVEATFAGSIVGPKPLPFFAKIAKRNKIACEEERYRDYAGQFIPFHLRPNLDPQRCLLGFARGILVGNFVEHAKPLWMKAECGEAREAIASLFSETLGGWRAQGFANHGRREAGGVAGALADRFNPKRVRDEHAGLAKSLGMKATPKEVWLDLLGRTSQTFFRAPIHGDLHPGNVFVRRGDAILIDLASVQHGPLSGDPACLETAFLFERRAGDDISLDEWRGKVDRLYAEDTFHRAPGRQSGAGLWVNRWNSAREVRLVGLANQACSDDYRTAVAVYLLRRGMHPAEDDADAVRRAYALVVAERIARQMEQDK